MTKMHTLIAMSIISFMSPLALAAGYLNNSLDAKPQDYSIFAESKVAKYFANLGLQPMLKSKPTILNSGVSGIKTYHKTKLAPPRKFSAVQFFTDNLGVRVSVNNQRVDTDADRLKLTDTLGVGLAVMYSFK